MKKSVFWVAALCVLTLCCCLFGCTVNVDNERIDVETALKKCNQKQTAEFATQDFALNISADAYNVFVSVTQEEKLSVSWVLHENAQVEVKTADGVCEITQKSANLPSAEAEKLYLVVNVPQNWENNDVLVQVEKCELQILGLTCNALTVENNVGDVWVEKCKVAKNVLLRVNTGAVVADLDARGLKISTTTGRVSATGNFDEKVEIATVVGAVNARCNAKSLEISTETGSVVFQTNAKEIDIVVADAGSVNGAIDGEKASFAIDATSGTGKCNLENQTGGENSLYVNTDVGSVTIKFSK